MLLLADLHRVKGAWLGHVATKLRLAQTEGGILCCKRVYLCCAVQAWIWQQKKFSCLEFQT